LFVVVVVVVVVKMDCSIISEYSILREMPCPKNYILELDFIARSFGFVWL